MHLRAGAFRGHHVGGFVIPDVAARQHVDRRTGSPDHDHMVDAALDFLDRCIGVGLERHLAAAAQAFVGSDDDFRLAVLDAAGERFRREAAEHHGVDRADARASEDGVRRLGNHRQVDGDAVALLDIAVAQHVGEAAHVIVQFPVGDFL